MKQCPKCNNTCSDEEIVCQKCGYVFTPEGFNYGTLPQGNSNSSSNYNGYNGMPNQGGFNGMPNQERYNNLGYQNPKTNGMAIASLVLGIVGVVFSCCYAVGIVPSIISLILGITSRRNIKRSNGTQKGEGMALAGIILSIIAIVLSIYMIISIAMNWNDLVNLYQNYLNMLQNNGSTSDLPF